MLIERAASGARSILASVSRQDCSKFRAEGVIVKTFRSIGDFLTRILGGFGSSSGGERGPEPGDGAVIHHSSGEADFDGLSGDVLPPTKDANRDLPYPPKRSGD